MKKIAITIGDPNSISPEITIKALNFLDLPKENVILISNKEIMSFYAENYDLCLEKDYKTEEIPFDIKNIEVGKETEYGGEFAFKALVKACELAQNKVIDALVTAPVSKNAMKLAGHNYSGQTEILEQYLANKNQHAEMVFVCENFSVFLLTRHIALRDVSQYVNKENIIEKVKYLDKCLKCQLNIKTPKYAMCALNPHSGEKGMFGFEEEQEISPAIYDLKNAGIDIQGPYPSDTLFANAYKGIYDYNCYMAMYHDQGLIPIKLMEKSVCVNTTLGLDIIRTSPSHGTAFDIAGKNIANPDSMIEAIKLLIK